MVSVNDHRSRVIDSCRPQLTQKLPELARQELHLLQIVAIPMSVFRLSVEIEIGVMEPIVYTPYRPIFSGHIRVVRGQQMRKEQRASRSQDTSCRPIRRR